jgi:hypothetical protein
METLTFNTLHMVMLKDLALWWPQKNPMDSVVLVDVDECNLIR